MDDSQSIDFKFIESYFKDKFSKPFSRRLKYIYLGLDNCEDTFVFSDTEDLDFKYCEALQTTGLVKIKNKEHLYKILQWFNLFMIDRTTPSIFYFNDVVSLLNKLKWDNPSISIVKNIFGAVIMSAPECEDVLVSRPIDTYFTLTKLQVYVDKYIKVFFNDEGSYYDVDPGMEKTVSTLIIPVSCNDLYKANILDQVYNDIKLVLLSGLDLLIPKSLIRIPLDYKYGVRLWAENGKRCINYGSFFIDADISICTSRDNIFIFPIIKKEV